LPTILLLEEGLFVNENFVRYG